MKLAHFLVPSMGMLAGMATAAGSAYDAATGTGTVWAQGVSQEGGWYDANKIDNNDGDADDNMCYAASVSNLLAWWQNGEYGKNLTTDAPKDINAIWQTYVKSNDNAENWSSGGNQGSALNWWVAGVYSPQTVADMERYFSDAVLGERPLTFAPFEGYYYEQYGLTQSQLGELINEAWIYTYTPYGISQVDFRELFNTGSCISLTVYFEGAAFSHAITMWGAEYENGELTAVWLTDSDDYYITTDPRLFRVAAELSTDENGEEKVVLKDFYGEEMFVVCVYALNASASENWQLVPEPSTATLSLLALVGLAMRRRKK